MMYTRDETASMLGISTKTLSRKYKKIYSFDEKWVQYMRKVYDLRRKARIAIKTSEEVRRSLKDLMRGRL